MAPYAWRIPSTLSFHDRMQLTVDKLQGAGLLLLASNFDMIRSWRWKYEIL